jgi:hypothetical protein
MLSEFRYDYYFVILAVKLASSLYLVVTYVSKVSNGVSRIPVAGKSNLLQRIFITPVGLNLSRTDSNGGLL